MALTSFDEFVQDVEGFLQANMAPLIVATFLMAFAILFGLKKVIENRNENIRLMKEDWKAIKKSGTFLTDRLTLYVSSLDGRFTELKGKCYRISSHRYKEVYDTMAVETPGKKAVKQTEGPFEIWKKTEVYAFMDRANQTVAAVRMSDLKPYQSLLSEVGYMLLSKIDPRRNNYLFYLIMLIEMLLITLLFWAIAEDRDLDFLLDSSMWGWYGLIIFAMGVQLWLMKALFGHFAVAVEQDANREEILLHTPKGKPFTLTISVSSIRPYWFRGCPIADVLALNTEALAQAINKENKAAITTYSAELANAESEITVLSSLVDQKALQLSGAFQRLQEERAIGYLEGRQDSNAELNRPEIANLGSALPWFKTAQPFLIAAVFIGGGVLVLKLLGDMINLTSNQTTILLIGLVVIAVAFLFISVRAIFESTRARQF